MQHMEIGAAFGVLVDDNGRFHFPRVISKYRGFWMPWWVHPLIGPCPIWSQLRHGVHVLASYALELSLGPNLRFARAASGPPLPRLVSDRVKAWHLTSFNAPSTLYVSMAILFMQMDKASFKIHPHLDFMIWGRIDRDFLLINLQNDVKNECCPWSPYLKWVQKFLNGKHC